MSYPQPSHVTVKHNLTGFWLTALSKTDIVISESSFDSKLLNSPTLPANYDFFNKPWV